ncbi:MAG: hypothetical protein WD738_01910 [Pirellulales bacterium]
MRHKVRALVGMLLIGLYFSDTATAQTRSRWWPFGSSDTEEPQPSGGVAGSGMSTPSRVEQQAPLPQQPAESEATQRWMIDSPRAKVSWPRIHLPEVRKPNLPRPQVWPEKSEVEAARNAWVEKNPAASQPSPLQAITDSARRVRASTRAAWDKTVDALTPGETTSSTSSRVARRQDRPPLWKRMFGVEEPEPQGPRTVTEWMAQQRLDP